MYTISAPALFNADIAAPGEALETGPFLIPVRFGLSNRMNRLLPYGNVAPVADIYSHGLLNTAAFSALTGSDETAISEISSLTLLPNNECRYAPHPSSAIVPEGCFFWENGVFGENILDVRFLRPLSKNLVLNAFSNYRHFDAMPYSHEGNNVYSFFRSLVNDSTILSNRGFNPLTNNYVAGAQVNWSGKSGKELFINAKYADCSDDWAIDRAAIGSALLWEQLNQYQTTITAGGKGLKGGLFNIETEAGFKNDALVRYKPPLTSAVRKRNDGANRELSFAVQGTTEPLAGDSLSLLYRVHHIRRKPFDLLESRSIEQTPELSVALPFGTSNMSGSWNARAGYAVFQLDDSLGYMPVWSLSTTLSYYGQTLRAYASQRALPYDLPYDSALFFPAPVLDRYLLTGGEVSFKKGVSLLVLGCQSILWVDSISVLHAWPEAALPYEQPELVFIVAPSVGPWHGLSLSTRACIADRRPYVKAHGNLSYSVHPATTREYIDLRLCTDYWSERDPITFAGITDWNRPVYDVSVEMAVHVISFRFFAKINNILNRKFAYVPGYYSPGITFRWGINWFLQK